MLDSLVSSGISHLKVMRLHNAVSLCCDGYSCRNEASDLKAADDFLIGIIGRLSPEKDVATFLEAAGFLSKKYKQLKFIVVGNGPEDEKLKKLAESRNLKEKVQFLGFIKEMESVYRSLDLLVISSKTEGIPLVILEAMKHAVPVVSCKVGGIPEVIENGVDGILVEPGNSHAIAEAIEKLLIDGNLYKRISKQALKKVETSFNRGIWIKKIEEIYQSMVM